MKRAVLSLVLILFVFGSVVAVASINNVEFFLQSNLTQQTILLVENISTPLVIVESRPSQNYFSLNHDITHNLVYLTLAYITPMFCQHLHGFYRFDSILFDFKDFVASGRHLKILIHFV